MRLWLKIISFVLTISVVLGLTVFVGRGLFPVKYEDTIQKYCGKYDADMHLVLALIKAESNFKEDALSHADASGLMQLTKETYAFFEEATGVKGDIKNPDDNIHAGVWYLSYLLNRYDGNIKNTLAAYNAGLSNVDNWLKDRRFSADGETLKKIPFGETARYTEKINRYIIIYRMLYNL